MRSKPLAKTLTVFLLPHWRKKQTRERQNEAKVGKINRGRKEIFKKSIKKEQKSRDWQGENERVHKS